MPLRDRRPDVHDSGDLAKWLPDGTVAFLGRVDTQVKIRGHRVECGEVEHAIVMHPDVAEAVVVARPAGAHHELVAYVVGSRDLDVGGQRGFLEQTLPAYLVPSRFVRLKALPLNANQKVDRAALPDPDEAALASGSSFAAPETAVQQQLVEIWQDVIGRSPIGIDDHYFHLGGDSIKAILILSRLRKARLTCEIGAFFEFPTIRRLSEHVSPLDRAIAQERVTGRVPLMPIQHWLLGEVRGSVSHFNQAVLLRAADRFDADVLTGVFESLLHHHDALRMVFRHDGTDVMQINKASMPVAVEVVDRRGADADLSHQLDAAQARFALETGPLLKAVLFRQDAGDALLVAIHHLVVDGVSWRILLEDLETAYRQLSAGERVALPAKTHSFKQWADALRKYAGLACIAGRDRLLELGDGGGDTIATSATGQRRRHALGGGAALRRGHRHLADRRRSRLQHARQRPPPDRAVARRATVGRGRSRVDRAESHGRSAQIPLDVSRTVGWFTTIYPVVLDLGGDTEIGTNIKTIKEHLRRIPNDGLGYGVLRYSPGFH